MADPIPAEWVSAVASAITRERTRRSSSAGAAVAVLEVVVPLVRAERAEGTVTEWALAYTHRPNVSGLPVRRVVQPYPDEQSAREAAAEVLALAPGDEPRLMRRMIGPWEEVPEDDGPAAEQGGDGGHG